MQIDRFIEVVKDQLLTLGGKVTHTVEPTERGYTVSLRIADRYAVQRFYSTSNVATISEQLLRVQVCHLYTQLAQTVLDDTLGEGMINVRR